MCLGGLTVNSGCVTTDAWKLLSVSRHTDLQHKQPGSNYFFFPENKLIRKEDQICLQNGSMDGYVQWSRCNLWKQTTAAVLVAPMDALSHGWFWLLFILAFADTPQQIPTAGGGHLTTEAQSSSRSVLHPCTQLCTVLLKLSSETAPAAAVGQVTNGGVTEGRNWAQWRKEGCHLLRGTPEKKTESCCQMLTSFQVSIYTPGCG